MYSSRVSSAASISGLPATSLALSLPSVFGIPSAFITFWLTTSDLGMGIQFVSTPMEYPEAWQQIKGLLAVPDDLELIAVYRLGYLPDDKKRPSIDWVSNHRKRFEQYVFRNTCKTPEKDPGEPGK